MAIRAFLSFVEEDMNLVNMFRGQAKNPRNPLEFHDYSVKVAINSQNADYIKRQIRDQINLCTMTVCLYGPTTHTSEWVAWELQETLDQGKPIMGVRLYNDGRIQYRPALLKDGIPCVDWNFDQIVTTMERLADNYRNRR